MSAMEAEAARNRKQFERLTPIFPTEQIILETNPKELSTRIIDMVAPIGRGQRGLIVSPPKAGKTTLLKALAHGITQNAPDIKIMVALTGERPEEVTDIRRSVEARSTAQPSTSPSKTTAAWRS